MEPSAVEALLRFLYTGAACAPDEDLEPTPLLELAVQYQVKKLVKAAAADMLIGVTPENARMRASALKLHADHAGVAPPCLRTEEDAGRRRRRRCYFYSAPAASDVGSSGATAAIAAACAGPGSSVLGAGEKWESSVPRAAP